MRKARLPLTRPTSMAQTMIAKLKPLVNFDLEAVISKLSIINNTEERKLFGLAVLLNIVAYGFFIAHHLLHNHTPRFPWIGARDQLFAGRWFNVILVKINYLADLPILGPLTGIAFSAAAGVLLLRVWGFKLTFAERLVAIGILTTFPICLSYFYYTYQTPLFFIAILFATAAMSVASSLSWRRILAGGVLALLAMGSYQASLSVMTTVVATAFIANLLVFKEGALKASFLSTVSRVIALAVGAVSYKLSLDLLGIKTSHATATIALNDLPGRFVQVTEASFRHLTLTQPDLLGVIKATLVGLLIAAAVVSVVSNWNNWRVALLLSLAWPATVVATKAMFLISSDGSFFQYRYNMSLAALHAFSFAALVHSVRVPALRSAALFMGVFVVMRFVQADLVRQEVLYRGEKHDLALANRILTRIEGLEELDITQTYDLVRVGKYSSFRRDALSSKGHSADTYGDGHMDNGEVTDRWTDEEVFVLLGSKIKFKIRGTDLNFAAKADEAKATVLKGREPWPHESSVFIHSNTIYVYMQ